MTDPNENSGVNSRGFDFAQVPAEHKQRFVNEVFSTVAERYDLMNDLMSGGLHRLWKDDLIAMLDPPRSDRPFRLIDVAGGTGDVALNFVRTGGPGCTAVICDISSEMLAVGRRKVEVVGCAGRIALVEGDAEALPFADRSFDGYSIAFGIRNVSHIDKALREAYRVLNHGGRFLCLEFARCQVPVLDRLYDFHSFEVIPRLGEFVAGARMPYEYLVASIREFPTQERFAAMMRRAGFELVSYRNLTGGIAAIHSGWRI